MAKQLSDLKRLEIGKLVLQGETFDRIATLAGVGKGSVAAISKDLRAGKIPSLQQFADQAEETKNLAADLRKAGIPVEKAALGFALLQRLSTLGIPLEDIATWADFCRENAPAGVLPESFMESVLELQRFRKEKGFSLEDLDKMLEEGRKSLSVIAEDEKSFLARSEALRGDLAVLEAKNAEARARLAGLREEGSQARIAAERASKKVLELAESIGRAEATLKGLKSSIEEKASRVADLEEAEEDLVARLGESKRLLALLTDAGFVEDVLSVLAATLSKMAVAEGLLPGQAKAAFFADLKGYPVSLRFRALRDALKKDVRKHVAEARKLRDELKEGQVALSAMETGKAKLTEEVSALRREKNEIGAGIQVVGETCIQEIRKIIGEVRGEIARLGALLPESGKFERELEVARFILAGERALHTAPREYARFWLQQVERWAFLNGGKVEHQLPKSLQNRSSYSSSLRLTLPEILSWAVVILDFELEVRHDAAGNRPS